MTYRGRVEGGVIVLEEGANLPEGVDVRVEVVEPAANGDEKDPMLQILDFAADTGIPELSQNIDHYLYGHPKVDDAGE